MNKLYLLLFIFIYATTYSQQAMPIQSPMPWYHATSIYQIYPRSFNDSNGDGIGDIQGIIQKLDYIQSLGYGAIWCSPFFKSPQQDFGYDISDYTDIAPEYGTMADVEQLIAEVHKRGMKMVFDMVMNHTSVQHTWFKESSSSKTNEKADWYIWRDKPNNWKSMTGGSGWHYVKERNQYYWASFLPFQPDLNYRNPAVKDTMLNTVRFWLKKGVDGFRLDIFNVIYKDAEFRNNPHSSKAIPTETDPSGFFQKAIYNLNRPESKQFAKELRAVCNEYGEKILLGEVSGNHSTIRDFMGTDKNDGLGLVFNFEMLAFKFKASYFYKLVSGVEADFTEPFTPVYCFSNHDRRRSIKRINNDVRKAKLLQLFQLTVRGVPCMYYGEEIGMTDGRIKFKDALDPIPRKYKIPRFLVDMSGETLNRDEVRTPMQWDSTAYAGFTTDRAKPWLPVNPDYKTVNVANEEADSNSLLNHLRRILAVRNKQMPLTHGSIELVDAHQLPKNVLGYSRSYKGEKVWVFINMGKHQQLLNVSVGENGLLYSCEDYMQTSEGKLILLPYSGVITTTARFDK